MAQVISEGEVWLTPEEAAKELKVSKGTLLHWRQTDQGPQYRKLGQGKTAPIRYPKHLVEEWKKTRTLIGKPVDTQLLCDLLSRRPRNKVA